jgi:hypothetical protein
MSTLCTGSINVADVNRDSWSNLDLRRRVLGLVLEHGDTWGGSPRSVTMYTLDKYHRVIEVEYQRGSRDLCQALDRADDGQTICAHVQNEDAADLVLPSVAYQVRTGALHMYHCKDMQARYGRPVYEVAGFNGIFHFRPSEEAERDELCDRLRQDGDLETVTPGPFRLARVIPDRCPPGPATTPQVRAESAPEASIVGVVEPIKAEPIPSPVQVFARIPEPAAPADLLATTPAATVLPVLDVDSLDPDSGPVADLPMDETIAPSIPVPPPIPWAWSVSKPKGLHTLTNQRESLLVQSFTVVPKRVVDEDGQILDWECWFLDPRNFTDQTEQVVLQHVFRQLAYLASKRQTLAGRISVNQISKTTGYSHRTIYARLQAIHARGIIDYQAAKGSLNQAYVSFNLDFAAWQAPAPKEKGKPRGKAFASKGP